MNKKVHKLLSIGTAVAFAASLTAAASAPVLARQAATSHASMKAITLDYMAGTSWPATLDPPEIEDTISEYIANMTESGLVSVMPNGDVAPSPGHPSSCWESQGGGCVAEYASLATKVTEASNRLSYTFYLRPGMKFADGNPITASSVAWSLWRALNKSTGSPEGLLYMGHIVGAHADENGKGSTLAGAHVVSKYVIRVSIDERIAYFLKTFSYPTADVLDKSVVNGKPAGYAKDYLTDTCVNPGAGQYIFKCLNHKDDPNHSGFYKSKTTPTITLIPNPKFWGPKPKVEVILPSIADLPTSYKEYGSGQVDDTQVPAPSVATEKKNHPSQLQEFPTSIVDYMTANEHPDSPFHDVNCRLAVDYGINRDAIDNEILHGTATATYQVLPGNIPPFSKNFENTSWDKKNGIPYYNVSMAKTYLHKCPELKNYSLTIYLQDTGPTTLTPEYRAIANMISQIDPSYGLTAKIDAVPFNTWLKIVGAPGGLDKTALGKVDITENLWQQDYSDAQDYLGNLLTPTLYDIGYFDNSTYNKYEHAGDIGVTPAIRNQNYLKAEEIALRKGAWIAIGNTIGYFLVKPYVHGLHVSAAYGEIIPTNNLWANVSSSK